MVSHGHLPEPRRDEVACQLGVAPHVAVEQPAVVVSPVRPPQRRAPASPLTQQEAPVPPSLADVMAEQLQEDEVVRGQMREAEVVRFAQPEPTISSVAAFPDGFDVRCKVSLGPAELAGQVLGSSRQHTPCR